MKRIKMLDYLKERYEYNEPIFLSDIKIEGMEYSNIRKIFSNMVKQGQLIKYDLGIYMFNNENDFSLENINPERVIYNKYIKKDNHFIGYIGGANLEYELAFSGTEPEEINIFTNAGSLRNHLILGDYVYNIKKSKISVTDENVETLIFLSLLEVLSKRLHDFLPEEKEILMDYVSNKNISIDELKKCAAFYPRGTRVLLERSGVIGTFEPKKRGPKKKNENKKVEEHGEQKRIF